MTLLPDLTGDLAMFHVGLVVPDMAAAVEQYAAALSLRFARVREIPLPVLVDGVPKSVELLATYSLDGPPYLELIEERSGATWAADAFGMNHVGFWARDMASAAARLAGNGLPQRVRDRNTPPRMSYHRGGTGVWIELVDHSVRETLDAWLGTSYVEG